MSTLKVETWADVKKLASNEPGGWLWDGMIPLTGIVLLAGDPLAGKTRTISVLLAAALAGDERCQVLGRVVEKLNGAVYLHLEHKMSALVGVLEAAGRSRDVSDFSRLKFLRRFDLDSDAEVDELLAYLDEHEIDAVVVDSLRRASMANESIAHDTAAWHRRLSRLTGEGKRLIIVIHHLNRHGDVRGSTDLPAGVDSELVLQRFGDVLRLHSRHHDGPDREISYRLVHSGEGATATLDMVEAEAPKKGGTPAATPQEIAAAVYYVVQANPGINSTALREQLGQRFPAGLRHGLDTEGRDIAVKNAWIENRGSGNQQRWFLKSPPPSPETHVAPEESFVTSTNPPEEPG